MGKNKPVKDKIKEKAAAVKAKLKGAKPAAAKCCILAALSLALVGCLDTAPASRATTASYRIDVTLKIDESSKCGTVNMPFTLGDGALASADSAGSTETQTATPTLDIRTKIDARYNDAMAAASTTSKGVIDSLTEASANTVLSLMADKSTGTVEVQKKDGTTATVECKDGQCSFTGSGNCTDN